MSIDDEYKLYEFLMSIRKKADLEINLFLQYLNSERNKEKSLDDVIANFKQLLSKT